MRYDEPWRTIALTIALATCLGASVAWAQAGPLVATETMHDALQRLQATKKPVELVLRNGKSYRGNLGSVGDHAVVVTEIAGREFYDAYILLDDITAVEVRARGDR